jgi:hypothetical protein
MSRYEAKVRKKIGMAAIDEDRFDVLAELEVAALLVDGFPNELEYEKYGTNVARAPDFTLVLGPTECVHFEVKRIRAATYERDVDVWSETIAAAIRLIPSRFAVSVQCHSIEEPFALLAHLQGMVQPTIAFVTSLVQSNAGLHASDEEYEVPNSGGRLSIRLSAQPKGLSGHLTRVHGFLFPIGFTQKEHYKFGDVVCAALGQLRSDAANVLMVTTGNLTHDGGDLDEGMRSLTALMDEGADQFFMNKGFTGAADFGAQLKRLNAVWFRSAYTSSGPRNTFWLNHVAAQPLPHRHAETLQSLDYQG